MRRGVSTNPGADAAEAARFSGFGPRALDFFRALAFHQDKGWFEANRGLYETDVRAPLETLVAALTTECAARGLPLRGDGRSIFRLHRDVRFAKDKRPYKTNGGAVLTADGAKRTPGLLYIHVDPEGCFVAAGFWHSEPPQLALLRRAIAADPRGFRTVLRKLGAAGLALGDAEALVRLPKGFEDVADAAIAAALKNRNFVVRRPLAADRLTARDLPAEIADFASAAEPLLRFGWAALGMNPKR